MGSTITHINGEAVSGPLSGPLYQGLTDANGDITATVTKPTIGNVTLTAAAPNACGTKIVSQSQEIWFYDPSLPPVDIFFCVDNTGSMWGVSGDHGAQASVRAFLTEMSSTYGIRFRVGCVRFNEGEGDDYEGPSVYDYILPSKELSISQFTMLPTFNQWLSVPYMPNGGDSAELQLEALHYAAQDMDTYATSENKYIVLLTDARFHYKDDPWQTEWTIVTTLTKEDVIDELTATGCPVYISLWDFEEDDYEDLHVNGGEFDPSKDSESNPTEPLYPLANLKARILADLD